MIPLGLVSHGLVLAPGGPACCACAGLGRQFRSRQSQQPHEPHRAAGSADEGGEVVVGCATLPPSHPVGPGSQLAGACASPTAARSQQWPPCAASGPLSRCGQPGAGRGVAGARAGRGRRGAGRGAAGARAGRGRRGAGQGAARGAGRAGESRGADGGVAGGAGRAGEVRGWWRTGPDRPLAWACSVACNHRPCHRRPSCERPSPCPSLAGPIRR
jgi:hypothetical protein